MQGYFKGHVVCTKASKICTVYWWQYVNEVVKSSLSTTSKEARRSFATPCKTYRSPNLCKSSQGATLAFILWSLGSGASCNFDQLAHGTTGKWISSINHRTLFRMEMKDSCPRLLKRQVWHHQSALYELALVHPQTFGEMSLLIFTQWPSCVRPALLTADASGVLSSRGGHLCLFSIRSASLSSLPSHLSLH